jgi:hypothetical protein
MQAYWNLKLSPSETKPELPVSVLVLLLPLSEPSLLVVTLSSSPPHAAKTSKKIPIKIGNVNFRNFIIESPPQVFPFSLAL